MNFEITILGCGAATPTLRRNTTSQLVCIHDKMFLVDCGENTQVTLRKHKIKFQKINQIFISHMHGDHYLGIFGLISSMHLLGRTKELTIYGPKGLKELVDLNLKLSGSYLTYQINHIEVDPSEAKVIFEDKTLTVESILLKHRIDCTGYLFREKPKRRRIDKTRIEENNLGIGEIIALKNGEDVVRDNGEILKHEELSFAPHKSRSYAFCSDTAFSENTVEQVRGVDALYHESTFLEDMKKRAKETFHSTAKQAGIVAKKANVGQLILGHFSSRYTDLAPFELEVKEEFENTVLASDGMKIDIPL